MALVACVVSPSSRAQTNAWVATGRVVRCSVAPQPSSPPTSRRSANYQRSAWDYDSIQSLKGGYKREAYTTGVDKLKEDVRHLIYNEAEAVVRLKLVDDLQRLGVGYLFVEEIKDVLGSMPVAKASTGFKEDIHSVALLFRLLREHGFSVSQDIFSEFVDNKGIFKAGLIKNTQGLLSLYEASQLAFEGEGILDEARIFTARHLEELMPNMQPYLKGKVAHALDLPLRWRAPRLEARLYIDQYERDDNMEPMLLQLAKLDFNKVQSIHQEELRRLAGWWRRLDFGERLSFARDRLTECFFFATGMAYEPHVGESRESIAKAFALICPLDDIYDVYGTLDELILFTNAIKRWETNAMDGLPEYMKTFYAGLYNTCNDIAEDILKKDGWDARPYFKKVWGDVCEAFLTEAKWHYNGHKPALEEYLENGWMSSSGGVLLMHAFCNLREGVTKEALQSLQDYPRLVRSPAKIFRLTNDFATSSAELERGDAPSSIFCYMRENNVSEEVARKALQNHAVDTWKLINEDVANCSPFTRTFANIAKNLGCISHCIYHKGDGLGSPDEEKKKQIQSLFFEPVALKGGQDSLRISADRLVTSNV